MRRTLVVMLKEPRPGRVKTRLGREIGMVDAAWWFRHQTRRLLRRLRDPRWDLVLAVSPDREGLRSRVWPHDLARMPQGRGDLGHRMARALRSAQPGPVCVIGADIPGIEPKHVADAFAALGAQDAVFGPAPDGGYWLVGLARRRALPPGLFDSVRWSTKHALADTLATLPGHRIARTRTLRDIDSADDLRMTAPGVRAT
ncbi:TIGR04282 family arsenosugar biosynthesis glycosyltransferase [Sulfitobacter sp. D35]|uniref:TIGR04282 family arsenosugar biosynthesis glycosyltransferase n=1 Tax=Sulfitobacter sp. D35 TaxID=3083252 RepID=UPI00296F616B|nr:TIGR04282 family arsenosugar biosynthesis glycosyltransferase [Sulfitobacter sp. D35]MDW4498144.1 TIGR04282 family arsenosugar biosynthesis glycosyltransferase [Sulfitobacter sp. D35]